jgi:hypothetical protein
LIFCAKTEVYIEVCAYMSIIRGNLEYLYCYSPKGVALSQFVFFLGPILLSCAAGAVYLRFVVTRSEHSLTKQKGQFRTIDGFSLIAMISVSLAFVSTAQQSNLLAEPSDVVSQSVASNIWMVPVCMVLLWFIATRELESLAVYDAVKRLVFVCLIAPIAALFAFSLTITLLLLFQCFSLPEEYPSPIPLGLLAIPLGLGLRLAAKWCLMPAAVSVVEYVE